MTSVTPIASLRKDCCAASSPKALMMKAPAKAKGIDPMSSHLTSWRLGDPDFQ